MNRTRLPRPLFNQPVKVDNTGRPLYNTWQQQEHERKIRYEQRQMNQNNSDKADDISEPSLYNTNTATSETSTTPSSAITNRPIQTQGDPSQILQENDDLNE